MTRVITHEQFSPAAPDFSPEIRGMLERYIKEGDKATLEHSIRVEMLVGLGADLKGKHMSDVSSDLTRTIAEMVDLPDVDIREYASFVVPQYSAVSQKTRRAANDLNGDHKVIDLMSLEV